jgi:hypothetical protein
MSSIKTTNPSREGEMILTEVPRMIAAERNELKTLVNERARLAVTQVRALAADRLVELNRQLAASWAIEDFEIGEMWKELRQIADTANTKIAARCDELGIHPDLRPRTAFGRSPIDSTRRAQLRQMAKDENDAAIKRATHQIDTWKLQARTELVRDGLTSGAAVGFLENIPAPADLLPATTADDLTRALTAGR